MTIDNAHPKPVGDAAVDAEIEKFIKPIKEFFDLLNVKIGNREVNMVNAATKAWTFLKSVGDLVNGLKPDKEITKVYTGVSDKLTELNKNMQERFQQVTNLALHQVFQNKVSIPSEVLWRSLMDYYENRTETFRDTFIQDCIREGPAVPIMMRARDLLPNILLHTDKQIGDWDQVIYMAAFKMMFVNIHYLMIRWPEAEFEERNHKYILELNTVIYDITVLLNEKDGKKTVVPQAVRDLHIQKHQELMA